jgi:hypothetical protein
MPFNSSFIPFHTSLLPQHIVNFVQHANGNAVLVINQIILTIKGEKLTNTIASQVKGEALRNISNLFYDLIKTGVGPS